MGTNTGRLRAIVVSLSMIFGAAAISIAGTPAAHAASCGSTANASLATTFRIVHFNVFGSANPVKAGYGTWTDRRAAVADRMSHVFNDTDVNRASIYGVTEARDVDASYLSGKMGSAYAYYATGGSDQAVIYSTDTWTRTGQSNVDFGDGVHGYVSVELKHKATGKTINVVEVHLDNDSPTARESEWASLVSKIKGWSDPTVVLGDMNMKSGFETLAASSGYCSARLYAEENSDQSLYTYRPNATTIDYAVTRNKIYMASYYVQSSWIDGMASSDHNMLFMQMRI